MPAAGLFGFRSNSWRGRRPSSLDISLCDGVAPKRLAKLSREPVPTVEHAQDRACFAGLVARSGDRILRVWREGSSRGRLLGSFTPTRG